jgi:hypothetical protein
MIARMRAAELLFCWIAVLMVLAARYRGASCLRLRNTAGAIFV